MVQVAARARADVPRDFTFAPAEVVGGGDIGEKVETEGVAQMASSLKQACRIDNERRLTMGLDRLDETWHAFVAHDATLRSSYAGGTPACTASCRRTMPSISCSGRGGQPGTYTSTGTTLSTDWTIA